MSKGIPYSLTIFSGLTDSATIKVTLLNGNDPKMVIPGTACFMLSLPPQRFKPHILWLNHQKNQKIMTLPNASLVNHIADPDLCSIALHKAHLLTEKLGRPCFNAPIKILGTRRDQLTQTLSGIPNLTIPRTIKLFPKLPKDFLVAVKKYALQYPIIVRLAGDQGGISTLCIQDPNEWSKIYSLAWGGRGVFLSEWLNYRDPDGYFRKYRIVMIEGRPTLRHLIVGKEWMLHRNKRDTTLGQQEEETLLAEFDHLLLPRIEKTLAAIHGKIGLNFFGMDCHISESGHITLFEANATMNILENTQTSPNCWDKPCAQIASQLFDALEKWAITC